MGTVETNNNTINFTANDDVVYNKYDVDNNIARLGMTMSWYPLSPPASSRS